MRSTDQIWQPIGAPVQGRVCVLRRATIKVGGPAWGRFQHVTLTSGWAVPGVDLRK